MTPQSSASRPSTAARISIALCLLVSILPVERVGAQEPMSDGQRLALVSKPAVVRVFDGYSAEFTFRSADRGNVTIKVSYAATGSGAFINPNGYAVTNAHVVRRTKEGEDAALDQLFLMFCARLYQAYNLDPTIVLKSAEKRDYVKKYSSYGNLKHFHHVILPNGDLIPFEIKAFGAPVSQGGKDVAVIKVELRNAPVLRLGNSEQVQLQDHVTVLGYPDAADTLDSGILDQKSFTEASITDGKVSAKKASSEGAPILQVSAPATKGNSGGPVLADSGEVVGLLTFGGDKVDGAEITGFAFAVPTSTVMEFVKQAGTTNEEGVADVRFREGLDLYLAGYYSEAIEKFEEVQRLFPQHSEASRLIQQSQQAIVEGRERQRFPTPLAVGIAVAVVALLFLGFLLLVAVVTFVVVRRSKKSRRAATNGATPVWNGEPVMRPVGYHLDPLATRITELPDRPAPMGTMPLGSSLDSTRIN